MLKSVRVGLLDSRVAGAPTDAVVATHRLTDAHTDQMLHGSQVASCVLQHCPSASLLVAEVFDYRREATVDVVLEGMAWLMKEGVQLINMSFGISNVSQRLARACREAVSNGVVLVASTPSCGGMVYPAAFDECIAATGDARCAPGETSWLASASADFGTHPFLEPDNPRAGGGASIAAARISGLIATKLELGVASWDLRSEMRRCARYVGPERRHE